jgi:hypothetical protein
MTQLVFLDLEFRDPDVRSTFGSSWIVPKNLSRTEDDVASLTPHCAQIDEFEWQIDQLHKELEEIRKRARRKYAAAKDKPLRPLFADHSSN